MQSLIKKDILSERKLLFKVMNEDNIKRKLKAKLL
jgi:hypothetical protein